MRVVLAPDSFKESMSAAQAAAAMARGVAQVWPQAECVQVAMADGGEGTLSALTEPLGLAPVRVNTTDPLGCPVSAVVGIGVEVAVIEVATAIGLELVEPAVRDIEHSTTWGLAPLVRAALDAGVRQVIIGIGGTATCDGGAGLLAGLGARLVNSAGEPVSPDPAGLVELARVELSGLDPRLAKVRLVMASDVTNPLLGVTGAAAVYAPQKGARPDQLPGLEAGLARLADALVAAGAADVRELSGAGAAGGLGAALLALGAEPRSGVELVAQAVGLAEAIQGSDLVLTGEGSLDAQTAAGKVVSGVLSVAGALGVPVLVFAGRIAEGLAVTGLGADATVAITPATLELAQALGRGPELLESAVAETLHARSR
jgi:glycerate 2-kinase